MKKLVVLKCDQTEKELLKIEVLLGSFFIKNTKQCFREFCTDICSVLRQCPLLIPNNYNVYLYTKRKVVIYENKENLVKKATKISNRYFCFKWLICASNSYKNRGGGEFQ